MPSNRRVEGSLLVLLVALAAIACRATPAFAGQPAPGAARYPLHEISDGHSPAPATSLEGVSATVEVQRSQRLSEGGGIQIRVSLLNAGDRAVALRSPQELLQLSVADRKGWPLLPPQAAGISYLINTRDPDPGKAGRSFEVVDEGGAPVSKWESVRGDVVRLTPGDTYWFTVRIPRLLAKSRRAPSATSPLPEKEGDVPEETVQVGPGLYKVQVMMTLIEAEAAGASRLLKSELLTVRVVN